MSPLFKGLRDMLLRPFRIIKDRLTEMIRRSNFLRESLRVISGVSAYKKLRKRVGANTHIIYVRGATGDSYLHFLLLDEYLRQKKITNFAVMGDSAGFIPLSRLFGISNALFVPTTMSERIEKAYLFMGGRWADFIIPFCWSDNFYINKCRVRMIGPFHFMDTYCYFSYGIQLPVQFRRPNFPETKERQIFAWQSLGIVPGRTVLISPDANSVTGLPVWFWNGIIKQLQSWGYIVFMNCNYKTLFRAPNLFPLYADCVPLLEYAGWFVGIRSGFCDIISSAKCQKIIIYPDKQKTPNYSFHRTELEFSGLAVMDLYQGDDLLEVSTPLIRNITDKELRLSGTKDYFAALKTLHHQILFPFQPKKGESKQYAGFKGNGSQDHLGRQKVDSLV